GDQYHVVLTHIRPPFVECHLFVVLENYYPSFPPIGNLDARISQQEMFHPFGLIVQSLWLGLLLLVHRRRSKFLNLLAQYPHYQKGELSWFYRHPKWFLSRHRVPLLQNNLFQSLHIGEYKKQTELLQLG